MDIVVFLSYMTKMLKKPNSILLIIFVFVSSTSFSQTAFPHPQAHAHNDYEHDRPLWDALENGFISVEADVHLVDGKLLVSHDKPKTGSPDLAELYLHPLDSLLRYRNGIIYSNYEGPFYLMIDCKTEAESTYNAILNQLADYQKLLCSAAQCPVQVYLSGNRAIDTIIKTGDKGIALDGRPEDLGKNIPVDLMPIISDTYSKWSSWKGKSEAQPKDLEKIRALAKRVHAEGKKLRLWAIPDNEIAWQALIDAGVDFINTDRLRELHEFLSKK